jgi:hypothetical protein
MQALGANPTTDDLAYPPGPFVQGTQLGDFTYNFDPAVTQPAIIAEGGTGDLLGGYPYSVFVGGDTLQLTLTVSNAINGDRLRAFGGDFYYAPSAFGVQSNSYLLKLGNGLGQGQSAGNLPLTSDMGSFFLGMVAAPGAEFTSVVLSIVQTDTNTIVPACQVSNLVYLKVPANPPLFSDVSFAGTTVTLQGSGGMPGTVFYLRASTNVVLPRYLWPRVATNYFDSNGGFTISDVWDAHTPGRFYTLEIP